MSFFDAIKGVYYSAEDKWYDLLDALDSKQIPVYKIIDPIDKIIPSFLLFLLLAIFFLILMAYLIRFNSLNEFDFIVTDSATSVALDGVVIAGKINNLDFSKVTDEEGKTRVSLNLPGKNLIESIFSLFFGSNENYVGILSVEKSGYVKINKKEYDLFSKSVSIKLTKTNKNTGGGNNGEGGGSASFSSSAFVELVDNATNGTIINPKGTSFVEYACANKGIQTKTSSDIHDGAFDGKFKLLEPNCNFVIKGAYSEGYRRIDSANIELNPNNNLYTLKLTKIAIQNVGTAKIHFYEKEVTPKKALVGLNVRLLDLSGNSMIEGFTDYSGVFQKEVSPGTYLITAVSVDGNYFPLTSDHNQLIVVKVGELAEKEIFLDKMDPALARIMRFKVVDYNGGTPLKDVLVYPQQVILVGEEDRQAKGVAGFCLNSCKTDSNGLITITGLSSLDEGKIVLVFSKTNYVSKIVSPQLFKTNSVEHELIEMAKTNYDPETGNSGKALIKVKSKTDLRPLYPSKTYLYFDSKELNINEINFLKEGKNVDSSGEAVFENIPKNSEQNYYAKAIFDSIEGTSQKKSIKAGQTVVFDINIITAVSFFEVNLFNGFFTGEEDGVDYNISTVADANVEIISLNETNPTPKKLTYDSTTKTFKSGLLDRGKSFTLKVNLTDYVPIEKEVALSIAGKNALNVAMYERRGEIQINFRGLFGAYTNVQEGVKSTFLDVNNSLEDETKGYYSALDIIVDKNLVDGTILSALRVNGAMNIIDTTISNRDYLNRTGVYFCLPEEKTPYNDDNYYIQSEECLVNSTNKGKQLGVSFRGGIRSGVYEIITKKEFAPSTKNGDKLKLNFSAKQNDYEGVFETKGEVEYEIGASLCKINPSNPNCSGIYFTTIFNGVNLNTENYGYNLGSKIFSKANSILDLNVSGPNKLTLQVFNNYSKKIDYNLVVYAYDGLMNSFNKNSSGFVKFDSINGPQVKMLANKLDLNYYTKSTGFDLNAFSNQGRSTSWIVIVAETSEGNYYLFLNTNVNGKLLFLGEGKFYSGLPDQKFFGGVVNSEQVEVELSSVKWRVLGNCVDGNILEEGDAIIDDSFFSMTIPGEYGYQKDCLKINAIAKDPIYEELNETLLAGIYGLINPELACVSIGVVESQNDTDLFLQWEGVSKVTLTNNCEEDLVYQIDSGVVVEGKLSGTLFKEERIELKVRGLNKSYSSLIKNSEVLGVFPLTIRAKLASSRKNLSQIKLLKVHLSNKIECFSISKDTFDLLKKENLSFVINNDCQYTLFGDYYIPKATLNLINVNLVDEVPKYDYVDFNYEILVHGGSYGLEEQIIERKGIPFDKQEPVELITSNRKGVLDSDGLRKYTNFETVVPQNYGADSSRLMFRWIDDELNELMGAKIDGSVTIKYVDGSTQTVTPVDNFEFKSNLSGGKTISCVGSHCEMGREIGLDGIPSTLRYGLVYVDFPKGKIKSVSFNILGNPNPENLFIATKLFLDYDEVHYKSSLQEGIDSKVIQSGSFRIYPKTETTFLLRNFANPLIDPELSLKAKLCKNILSKNIWVADNRIFWFDKHFDNYDGALSNCYLLTLIQESDGELVDSPNSIPQELITKWNNNLSQFSWIDSSSMPSGFWTNDCTQDTCKVLNKTQAGFSSGSVGNAEKIDIVHYAPLCVQPFPDSVDVRIINEDYCKSLNVVCDSSGDCIDGLDQLFDAFTTTEFGNITDPQTELRITSARTNSTQLDNSVIMIWIEGGILKAKFLGENYEGYDDYSIELSLEDKGLVGDVYGRIKVIDYINRINVK